MTYFTMQVHLQDGKTVHEFKDIEESNLDRCRDVWQRGVKVQTSPIAFELISPFFIKHVYLIRQDQKFGTT